MGKKGRSRRLIALRNQKIAERYYYWTEVRRLRFDDAVKILSEQEFFLSEFMIWQILKKNSAPGTPSEFKVVKQTTKIMKVCDEQPSLFPTEVAP